MSRESDGSATFGRIRSRLGVIDLQIFRLILWLLHGEFASCGKPPNRDNHLKEPYLRTLQRDDGMSWTNIMWSP